MPRMHQNALCDLHIPADEKHTFGMTCLDTPFLQSVPGPPKLEK
jgi:hypothetical protein